MKTRLKKLWNRIFWTKAYRKDLLDKAIQKAKPNMDKIKDVDKHLDDIK